MSDLPVEKKLNMALDDLVEKDRFSEQKKRHMNLETQETVRFFLKLLCEIF
jgi:hypothetical protein